jgi:hypothetical protein
VPGVHEFGNSKSTRFRRWTTRAGGPGRNVASYGRVYGRRDYAILPEKPAIRFTDGSIDGLAEATAT